MTRPANAPGSSTPLPPLETSFFGALFGGCCRGPQEEGELNMEAPEASTQKKKEKKSRGNKDSCSVTTSADTRSPHGAEAATLLSSSAAEVKPRQVSSCYYRIDNSILKIENRPGLAFRCSKREADKVKGDVGPAKWDEIVEGVDEGDGWLKVGAYFLPMKYQGIPVVTLVAEGTEQDASLNTAKAGTRGEKDPADPAGARPSEPSATKSPTRNTCQVSDMEERKACAAELSTDVAHPKGGLQAGAACAAAEERQESGGEAEQEELRVDAAAAEEDAAVAVQEGCSADTADTAASLAVEGRSLVAEETPEGEVAASQGGPAESGAKEEFQERGIEEGLAAQVPALQQEQQQQEQEKQERQQQCAWYMRPSVGTWLQALPQPVAAAAAAAAAPVAEVPKEEQCHCVPRPQEAKAESPTTATHWVLLPSVTTWYSRRLPASAHRSHGRSLSQVQTEEGAKASEAALVCDDSKTCGKGAGLDQWEPHPKED